MYPPGQQVFDVQLTAQPWKPHPPKPKPKRRPHPTHPNPFPDLENTCTRHPPRARSSTNELGTFVVPDPKFLFTPADDTPPPYSDSPHRLSAVKSVSSPHLRSTPPASPYGGRHNHGTRRRMSEDDDDYGEAVDSEDELIRAGSTGDLRASSSGLRTRMFGIGASSYSSPRHRDRSKGICTTPGELCAGETETEVDEPPKHLPTARIIPASAPLVPPGTLQQSLTPLLFEFSRLLSIVPAVFGTLYHLYHLFKPPLHPGAPQRVDFAVSAIWAVLTGYQCLCLTTGLLTRWRLYYPPLSTLIRLLALQGICWPATQLTCTILEHAKRPVIVWAVIGTTTCVSRGVQMWVTSNLWWETREGVGVGAVDSEETRRQSGNGDLDKEGVGGGRGYWKRWGGGKWGGRRWDWKEVGVKCVLPAGVVYCVMAWAEQLRREFSGC